MSKEQLIPRIKLPKRAETPEQKQEVMDQLLQLWLKCPELRLGQLIDNAMYLNDDTFTPNLFSVEDFYLIEMLEKFVSNKT